MKFIKFNKAGRWQDKPYQKQFEVAAGQEVEVASGTTFDDEGNVLTVSYHMASIVEDAGKGEMVTKETPPAKDKAKAESNAGVKDKAKSESK